MHAQLTELKRRIAELTMAFDAISADAIPPGFGRLVSAIHAVTMTEVPEVDPVTGNGEYEKNMTDTITLLQEAFDVARKECDAKMMMRAAKNIAAIKEILRRHKVSGE